MPLMMASTPTAGDPGEVLCALICSRSASRRAASSARSASRSRSRLLFSSGEAPTRTTTSGESSHPGLAVVPPAASARERHSDARASRRLRVCSSRRRMRSRKSSGLASLFLFRGEETETDAARSRFEEDRPPRRKKFFVEEDAPATPMNRVAASRSVDGSKTRASNATPGAVVPPVWRNARAPPRAAVRSRGGTPSRARSSAARSCASALAAKAFDSRTAASRRDAARVDASSASASCLFFAASAFSRRRSVSSSDVLRAFCEASPAPTPRAPSASRVERSCRRRACPRAATDIFPPEAFSFPEAFPEDSDDKSSAASA